MALFYVIIEFLKVKTEKFNYKSLDKTKFLVLLVTLFMAIKHVKMMPFFVLTGTVFCYEDVINYFKKFNFPKWSMPSLIAFLTFYSVTALAIKDYRPMINYNIFPVMEVEFIRANKLEGKLLTNFGIGSFASYKLYPQNKIYMDGRYEEVYDDWLLDDLSNMFSVRGNHAFDLIIKNRPDIIILEKSYNILYHVLMQNDQDWQLAFEGVNFGVFVSQKIAKPDYIPPNGDLKYYKKTILNTMINFKGKNAISVEEINKKGNQNQK